MKNSIFLTLAVSALFVSCKKVVPTLEREESSPSAVAPVFDNVVANPEKVIESLGFDKRLIRETNDYFIVDGDILFPKNRIYENTSIQGVASAKHAYGTDLVSLDNHQNITVKIDPSIPSGSVSNWRVAIEDAFNNWNAISNCRLNFTFISSGTPDLLVKSDAGMLQDDNLLSLDPYPIYLAQAAAAEYPYYGKVGSQILVNIDIDQYVSSGSLSLAQKVYNISHCIGHAVGFRHTDFISGYESSYRRITIPGTPTYDANSIMNYQDYTRTWSFSTEDTKAIQYLYGKGIRVCLKTWNGNYAVAENGGGGNASGNSANPWSWETFHLMESPLYGAPYYVLQCTNGDYLQASNGGGGNVTADSSNPWDWETFELIPSALYPGKYNLKVKGTSYYLQADQGGGSGLNAISTNPWSWESFELVNSWY